MEKVEGGKKWSGRHFSFIVCRWGWRTVDGAARRGFFYSIAEALARRTRFWKKKKKKKKSHYCVYLATTTAATTLRRCVELRAAHLDLKVAANDPTQHSSSCCVGPVLIDLVLGLFLISLSLFFFFFFLLIYLSVILPRSPSTNFLNAQSTHARLSRGVVDGQSIAYPAAFLYSFFLIFIMMTTMTTTTLGFFYLSFPPVHTFPVFTSVGSGVNGPAPRMFRCKAVAATTTWSFPPSV